MYMHMAMFSTKSVPHDSLYFDCCTAPSSD